MRLFYNRKEKFIFNITIPETYFFYLYGQIYRTYVRGGDFD